MNNPIEFYIKYWFLDFKLRFRMEKGAVIQKMEIKDCFAIGFVVIIEGIFRLISK